MGYWQNLIEAYAVTTLNQVPRVMHKRFPDILWMGNPALNQIALSYDDGPHPRDTPALLEVLAHYHVIASFAWLGERVEANPELVASAAAAGHQLLLHGYRHRSFLTENRVKLRGMLDHTRDVLARSADQDPQQIRYVRPPFGHLSAGLVRDLRAWGYQPVLGSIMPVHWYLPAAFSVRQVTAQASSGSLIVLHESLNGPPVAQLTDSILIRLVRRGLRFVTIETLRAGTQGE
jgi:peptidoglycan/xylan/chitin deacetylase (PgdA/CDA1 family)